MRRSFTLMFSVLVVLSLLLSACTPAATPTEAAQPTNAAQQPTNTTAPQAANTTAPEPAASTVMVGSVAVPEVDPAEVSGDIISAGSSTVFPLSEAVVNLFESEGYAGQVTIDSIGTGAGFERFCKGEIDISNASRKIKDSEVETCQAAGIEPVEFRVGTDAIAIEVNPKNTFLTNITKDELAMAFSGESEKWSEVNPAWLAETIKRYAPGTDSGTYDYFIEAIMQPKGS